MKNNNLEFDKWETDLLGAPSQCYFYTKLEDVVYCLYLRWRWDDPWTFTVVILDGTLLLENGEWSDNLFVDEQKNIQHYFKHDDYLKAQDRALEIFKEKYT